jgi:hypothetical protein
MISKYLVGVDCKITFIGDVVPQWIVQDSSAVRRLFIRLAGDVRVLNIWKTADLPLQLCVDTFRGYRILFSIRNPYINRFANRFSVHS